MLLYFPEAVRLPGRVARDRMIAERSWTSKRSAGACFAGKTWAACKLTKVQLSALPLG
jgi:hypothetical protein